MSISIRNWSDHDIHEFLNDLDKDSSVELTDWEAGFVGSNLDRSTFTEKQREIVQKLVNKYETDG